MNSTDASAAVLGTVLGLLLFAGFYVWISLALAAVFGKSGVEPFKAWVPVLNGVVLLQLAGVSPWLLLLALVPVLGAIAVFVVFAFALHRLSVAFGYGVGMTVLGVLLSPVWASVIGWGSARWVGREPGRSASSTGPSAATAYEPRSLSPAVFPTPAAASGPVDGWAPQRVPSRSAFDDAVPRRTRQAWPGYEAPDVTGEVTGAISAAPTPIVAVPGAHDTPVVHDTPPVHDTPVVPRAAPPPVTPPPVTRVPLPPTAGAEPWAPVRSPSPEGEASPEGDAFPEASGPVSAVVGAPDAGTPRSARGAVSAQHVLPHLPDDVDETVISVRRRVHWSLERPSGAPVVLTGDVVLVGRRPTPSTAYPDAQLVEVDDGTVSKTHLRLERDGESWTVTDLHSTNGTILIASDGAEREIQPGNAHRAAERMLAGDAELRLTADAGLR